MANRTKGYQRLSGEFEYADSKNVNSLRKEFGMTPLVVKYRECLKCGRTFRSRGPQNRLCCVSESA